MIANIIATSEQVEEGRCWCCAHLKGAVSWWCTNEEAKKEYGTNLPDGKVGCKFWMVADNPWYERGIFGKVFTFFNTVYHTG